MRDWYATQKALRTGCFTERSLSAPLEKPHCPPSKDQRAAQHEEAASPCVLVVDDSPSTIRFLRSAFDTADTEVLSASSAAEGIELVANRHPDVVLLDIALPDQSGLESFEQIKLLDAQLPVIFITASGNSQSTIEAMKKGAFDFLLKPLDLAQVRQLVEQALKIRRFMHIPVCMSELGQRDATGTDLLIGRCSAMQEVYKAIGRVAQQNIPVLIRGESGTGKELVARAIYQHSPRSNGHFLAVNCAAIPESLLESELFGYEKGAFTGAAVKRIGKFEQCNGGTVFLDEVGDMTPLMQSKVLRVLQDNRFERVGGNETVESDAWIVAATNRDLEAMVAHGDFRADLYYRLNGFPIILPPLRERGSDIALLVEHFLALFSRAMRKTLSEVSSGAMDLLVGYSWPGNVRELQSTLKQAMLQATGPVLLPEFLPSPLQGVGRPELSVPVAGASQAQPLEVFINKEIQCGTHSLYTDTIASVERILLTRVLCHTDGNQSQAARILGMTRGFLRNKIREHGIAINSSVHVTDDYDKTAVDALVAAR
jgi:two-component system, NtrC family, nitrogen regulation response regulator GlnG